MGKKAGRWFPLCQPARRNWPLHAGRSKCARPPPKYGSLHKYNLCESTLRDMSSTNPTTIPTRGVFFSFGSSTLPSQGHCDVRESINIFFVGAGMINEILTKEYRWDSKRWGCVMGELAAFVALGISIVAAGMLIIRGVAYLLRWLPGVVHWGS